MEQVKLFLQTKENVETIKDMIRENEFREHILENAIMYFLDNRSMTENNIKNPNFR